MTSLETRRVILAGIRESRLDLFLLLNEGAGYEVTGVVAAQGNGETSRIAEILGVRVFSDTEAETLPTADLLIYGEERYRELGDRLGLAPAQIWDEDRAWNNLVAHEESARETKSSAEPIGGEAGEATAQVPTPMGTDEAEEDAEEAAVAAGAASGAGRSDQEPGRGGAPAWRGSVSATAGSSPRGGESGADPARQLPAHTSTPRDRGAAIAPTPPAPDDGESVPHIGSFDPGALELLHAFARAGHDLETLYRWILGSAMKAVGAAAGGLAPLEPIRPYVWQDRRQTPRGELPGFLKTDAPSGGAVVSEPLGDPGSPGSARLVLVGASSDHQTRVRPFLDAVAPGVRTAAEMGDLRRQQAWDEVVRRVMTELETTDPPAEALTESCRSVAELLGARECVVLFRSDDGEVLRGYSSSGDRIVLPARTGLLGGRADSEAPGRLVDESGEWHFLVPFTQEARRGVLALHGVPATPGSAESVAHQAVTLTRALAAKFPETAWRA